MLLPIVARGAEPPGESLRAEIAELRAELARIDALQRETQAKLVRLESEISEERTSPPPPAPATAAAASIVAPTRLTVTGDLRLRTQGDYADSAPDRISGQVRGRLGATYAVNDRLQLGARLVTGDPDDPNSVDAQLSNFDDDLQVSLDLAYLQLSLGDLRVYGGKIPQPFVRTELVWDGDVNPQGLGAVYRRPLADGALRAAGLFFVVDESAAGADSTMRGLQLGFESPAFGAWSFDASAAYYDYQLGSVAGADGGDFRSNLRDARGNYLSDFNIGDLIVGATWSGLGRRWPVKVIGDYAHNFGAATRADTGWGIDLIVGRAREPADWRLTYGYSQTESDAVFAAFSSDNIALATNYRQHALTLDYVPKARTTLSAIWYHYRPYRGVADPDWIERIRLAFMVSL